jgi:hypothetical protein
LPTFSDAIAAIRWEMWTRTNLKTPSQVLDAANIPADTLNSLIDVAI